jgi:hypothetical protein
LILIISINVNPANILIISRFIGQHAAMVRALTGVAIKGVMVALGPGGTVNVESRPDGSSQGQLMPVETLPYGQCLVCMCICDELKDEKRYPEGCRLVLCDKCRKKYRELIEELLDAN